MLDFSCQPPTIVLLDNSHHNSNTFAPFSDLPKSSTDLFSYLCLDSVNHFILWPELDFRPMIDWWYKVYAKDMSKAIAKFSPLIPLVQKSCFMKILLNCLLLSKSSRINWRVSKQGISRSYITYSLCHCERDFLLSLRDVKNTSLTKGSDAEKT